MKSALELAMERTGGNNPNLTAEQKAAIEEIRSIARAKTAEEEIMANQQLAAMADPAAIAQLKEQSAARKRKIEADAEDKVERIRAGKR